MTLTAVIALIFLVFILIPVLLESSMYLLIRHPKLLKMFSRRFRNSISYLYIQGDRKIMQFQKGCGRYSPDLGYTLNPGAFTYTEIEFSNEYRINSLGVRDTQESLNAPEIVLLGDSFALGWGVDASETFIKLVGEKTSLTTLNTCVPSFGTVREMIMLRKVDRSRLKYLFLQYCADDYDENRLYFQNGNRPQLMREQTFAHIVNALSRPNSYYPGKYLRLKIRKKLNAWKTHKPPATTEGQLPDDVELFIHILKQNADLLTDIPLIVFELSGINQTDDFTRRLREKIKAPDEPSFIRNLLVLDIARRLEDRHFYVLDGHLNAAGHAVAADILCKVINDLQKHP
jgi:hypothetical protein